MSELSYSPSKSKHFLKKRNGIGRLDDKLSATHSVFPMQGKIKDYTITKNHVGWNYYEEQKYKDTMVINNQKLNHVECKDIMNNMMKELKMEYNLATSNIPAPINPLFVVLNMPQIVKFFKKIARIKIKTCLLDRFNKWTEVVQYINSMTRNRKILERCSAICVQRFIRGYLAKLKAYRLAERKELLRRNRIIVIVQCAVRIFLAKKKSIRSIRLREEQRTAAIKQKHLDSAIIIQKTFRGYLLRGKLANIERILLFRDLCTWANGFANKLFDRKKLKDRPTQKLLLNAIALSFLASRPLRLLPTCKQFRIVREALKNRHTVETIQSSNLRLQYIHRQLDRANMFEEDKLSNNIRRHIASVQKHEYLVKEIERIQQLREETEAKKRLQISEIMKTSAALRAEEINQKTENEEMFRAEYTQRRVLAAQKAVADRHRSREQELIHREDLLMRQLRRSEEAWATQQRLHIDTLSHIRDVKLAGDEECGEGGQRFHTSILDRNIRKWKTMNSQITHKNNSHSSNDSSPSLCTASSPLQSKVVAKSERQRHTGSVSVPRTDDTVSSYATWEDELCSWKNHNSNCFALHANRKKSYLDSNISNPPRHYSHHPCFDTLVGKLSTDNRPNEALVDKKHWWRHSMPDPRNSTDQDNTATVTHILSSDEFISGTELFEKERIFISKFRLQRENNVNNANSSTGNTHNSSKATISLIPLITKVGVNLHKDVLLEFKLLLIFREIRQLRLLEYNKLTHSVHSFRSQHRQLLQQREALLKGKYPTRTVRKQQLTNVMDTEWSLSFYRMAIIKASKNICHFIKEELLIFIQLFLPDKYSLLKKKQEEEEIKLENARKEEIQKKINEANKLIQKKQSASASVASHFTLSSTVKKEHQSSEIHNKHPHVDATSKKSKPKNSRKNPTPAVPQNKKAGHNSGSVNTAGDEDAHHHEEAAAAAQSEKLYHQYTSHFHLPRPPVEQCDDDALGKTSDRAADFLSKRKAARRSGQPGFVAFSDGHPQTLDFFQWGENTINWTSCLAKWMTGQEAAWRQRVTPRCLGFLQRLQYLTSLPCPRQTEDTSASSSGNTALNYGRPDGSGVGVGAESLTMSDVDLMDFILRSDVIDLLEMLTNRLQIELSVYDSVSQITAKYSLDDREAEIVLARHPASCLARILLLRGLRRSEHFPPRNDLKIQHMIKASEEEIPLSSISPSLPSTTNAKAPNTDNSKHTIAPKGSNAPESSIQSTNLRNIAPPASASASASETHPDGEEEEGSESESSRSTSAARRRKREIKGGHADANLRPRSLSKNSESESEARSFHSDSGASSAKDSKRGKARTAARQTPSIHKPSTKQIREKRKKSSADSKAIQRKSVPHLNASLGSFYFPVDIPAKEGDDIICDRDRIEILFQTLNWRLKERSRSRVIVYRNKKYVLHRFIDQNLDDIILKAAYMEFIDIHDMIDRVIEKRYFEVRIKSTNGTGIITQRPNITPGIFVTVNKSLQEWSVRIPSWMQPVCYWGTPAGAVPSWHRRASKGRRSTANVVINSVVQLELQVDEYAKNVVSALKERLAKTAKELSNKWIHAEREHMQFEDAMSSISNYEHYYLEKDELQASLEEEEYQQALQQRERDRERQRQLEENARESPWSNWTGSIIGRNEVKIHSTIDAEIEPKIVASPSRLKRRDKYEVALVAYKKSVVSWPKYRQKIHQKPVTADKLPATQAESMINNNLLQVTDITNNGTVNSTETLLQSSDVASISKTFTWLTEERISLSSPAPLRHRSLVQVQYLPPREYSMDVKEVWVAGGLSHVMVVMRVVSDCYIAPRGHQIVEYLPAMEVATSARLGFSDRPLCQNTRKAFADCKTSHDRYLSESALGSISIEEPAALLPGVDYLKGKLELEVKSIRYYSGSDEFIRGIVLLQRKVREKMKFRCKMENREF